MKIAALILLVRLFGFGPGRGSAVPRPLTGVVRTTKLTLLTDVGKLAQVVPASEVAHWKRMLHSSHLSAKRAAKLHLWLGEIELARNREPERALWHFRQAQLLARRSDPVYGRAAYDRAMTLFFQGAYTLAADAFHNLLQPKAALNGCSHRDCALWYRHAAACAGYHAQHAKLGITEPPRLDPHCGVAALAACLKAHGRPYDRKTLLSHCRMTGLGNNMQDLLDGARRLGMAAWAIKADDDGLQTLPKPLVAYVEGDHFVAVTRADRDGVSYLCSDCGAWPGGRRDLTWKQWRAMDCNLYLVATHQSSRDYKTLNILFSRQGSRETVSRRPSGNLAAYTANAPAPHDRMMELLGAHTKLYLQPTLIWCDLPVASLQETPNQVCPFDCQHNAPGATPEGDGPTSGDPVNLATGEEEYRPEPDLVVYNPIGPSVVWRRQYGSLRGPQGSYQLAFGYGWNTVYDMQVGVSGSQVSLYLPNGSSYPFSAPSTPTASNPQVSCPSAANGLTMLCTWVYNADGSLSFVFTKPDRSQWVFSSLNGYALTQLIDRNGNYINFVYNNGGTVLIAVTDRNNLPLLTIHHNANLNITSVSDRYSRSVYYKVQRFPYAGYQAIDELVQVSQIVRTGAHQQYRFAYGYQFRTDDG